MPYDLYGQYYASERDAINAELAQCAEIDARIANQKVADLERRMQYAQQPRYDGGEQINHLWQKIQELEQRIAELEKPTT